MTRRRTRKSTLALLAGGALAVAGGAVPATAGATAIKGEIASTPYVADSSHTALPVLLSKETVRRNHIHSPFAVLVVPRHVKVAAPYGLVEPSRLQVGDRLETDATITRAARRARGYGRIAASSVRVSGASRQFSSMLGVAGATAKVRDANVALTTFVAGLTQFTVSQLQGIATQLQQVAEQMQKNAAGSTGGSTSSDPLTQTVTSTVSALDSLTKNLQDTLSGVLGGAAPSTPTSDQLLGGLTDLLNVSKLLGGLDILGL